MNSTKHAIIIAFYSVLVKGKKHYCTPRPDTTIKLLNQYHGIDIQRRWFFQCCRDMEAAGYIARQRRWEKLPGPEIRSKSSIWVITVRGLKYLIAKGVSGARELLRPILNWLHSDDKRAPTANALAGDRENIDRQTAMEKIRQIIKDIG